MAQTVNISLGTNTNIELEKIEALKSKELADRSVFEIENPEVTLLASLDSVLNFEEYPPLNISDKVSLKDPRDLGEKSWVKIASKSMNMDDSVEK